AGRAEGALTHASRRLANELRIRDEVDRRVAALSRIGGNRAGEVQAKSGFDNARQLSADVRRVAQDVGDPALRDRLLRACARYEWDASGDPAGAPDALSPRELDVLAEVALDQTNVEVAEHL